MTISLSSIIPPIVYGFKGGLIHKKLGKYNLRDELAKQISEIPEINKLFSDEKIKKHFVYEPIRDTNENPDLYITQLRFYWYYKYLKHNYPDIFEKATTVLDVGGTSEIFIKSINKKGTVLNINQECVTSMKQDGIEAIRGDAESIDLPDISYDYITCFQCIEHVPNPLKVLNELGRLVKKKVFISIPYVEKTTIRGLDYWINQKKESWKEKNVKDVDCHIFEFSTEDFKKVLSYTNLNYEKNLPILYFDNNTPFRKFYNKNFGSYFNFFVLSPKKM